MMKITKPATAFPEVSICYVTEISICLIRVCLFFFFAATRALISETNAQKTSGVLHFHEMAGKNGTKRRLGLLTAC